MRYRVLCIPKTALSALALAPDHRAQCTIDGCRVGEFLGDVPIEDDDVRALLQEALEVLAAFMTFALVRSGKSCAVMRIASLGAKAVVAGNDAPGKTVQARLAPIRGQDRDSPGPLACRPTSSPRTP